MVGYRGRVSRVMLWGKYPRGGRVSKGLGM